MPPDSLRTIAILSLAASAASALIIGADILAGRRQKMAIMVLVWPITALYMGPFGLWAYWAIGRARPAGHEDRGSGNEAEGKRSVSWRSVFKATCHCGAGCSLGDSIGETGLYLTGITLFGSALLSAYFVDFTLAYLIGIVFQFFSIAPMRGLGLRDGLVAAVKADTISLIAFEVGMFGWMALSRFILFDPPPEANSPVYWASMQVAMLLGFATSFPANWALVRAGLKEAM